MTITKEEINARLIELEIEKVEKFNNSKVLYPKYYSTLYLANKSNDLEGFLKTLPYYGDSSKYFGEDLILRHRIALCLVGKKKFDEACSAPEDAYLIREADGYINYEGGCDAHFDLSKLFFNEKGYNGITTGMELDRLLMELNLMKGQLSREDYERASKKLLEDKEKVANGDYVDCGYYLFSNQLGGFGYVEREAFLGY